MNEYTKQDLKRLGIMFIAIALFCLALWLCSGCLGKPTVGVVPISHDDIQQLQTQMKAAIDATNSNEMGAIKELSGILTQMSVTMTNIDNSMKTWNDNSKTTYGIEPWHIIAGYLVWEFMKYFVYPWLKRKTGIKKE